MMRVGMIVDMKGWASYLSFKFERNLWEGSRPFGRSARVAYKVALNHWYEYIFPQHFKRGAKSRYSHQPRKRPYLAIKRALAEGKARHGKTGQQIRGREARVIRGGLVDIVRSGQTERVALAGAVLSATPKEGVLSFAVPAYITRRYRSDRPDMANELLTLTKQEHAEVSDMCALTFIRRLEEEGRRAPRRKFVIPAK